MTGHHRHSAEGRRIIAAAEQAQAAADRAFGRVMAGKVATSSAAARLANAAEERWADVRHEVELGELIESDWSEADIADAEREAAECAGHPAGPGDAMGTTTYCDGTCRPAAARAAVALTAEVAS